MAYNSSSSSSSNSEVTTCTKTYLKNYETLKKQYDDLIVKLNDTEFKASTYKRGLATVEAQLVTFRKNEVLFSEEIIVLKREVGCKNYEIGVLKTEYEKVKQEKEGYHVVAPPHPLSLNAPTKLDLSYSGLEEFQQPEFEGYRLRANKNVCKNSSNEPKKSPDAPLIEEWVSDNEDEVESPLVVVERITVVLYSKDKLILLDQRQWLMLLGQIGLMQLRPQHVRSRSIMAWVPRRSRFYDLQGNLDDKIGRFYQFDDEKRAGAELTEENDKSQYKKCLDTSS
ncbi:hypothetical protein Tco_0163832 [Tanacetum coccineum]